MMYSYGNKSIERLETCHPDLQKVAHHVMGYQLFDITIIWGHRNIVEQTRAFDSGNSKKEWPDSKHNFVNPSDEPESDALDFGPWCLLPSSGQMGIPWEDTHAFAVLGGLFLAAGAELGIGIRYGGDWDMDGLTTDQILMDWGHVERLR